MLKSRTSIWLFAALWLALTAFYAIRGFDRSSDHTLPALIDWSVIGIALIAPLFALRRLFRDVPGDARTLIHIALRLVLIAYLPLWTALRLLDRSLSLR